MQPPRRVSRRWKIPPTFPKSDPSIRNHKAKKNFDDLTHSPWHARVHTLVEQRKKVTWVGGACALKVIMAVSAGWVWVLQAIHCYIELEATIYNPPAHWKHLLWITGDWGGYLRVGNWERAAKIAYNVNRSTMLWHVSTCTTVCTTLAAKKIPPLGSCIKSESCSYHGISKNQAWFCFGATMREVAAGRATMPTSW